jgi:hypothetical protein
MVAVHVAKFGGMLPAIDDRKLPDSAATFSQNVFLYSGALQGLRTPRVLRDDLPVGTTYSYRIPLNMQLSHQIFGDSVWLDFANAQTNVIKAPVFGDTFDRYYWASSTGEPRYNTLARIIADSPSWLLGVPGPEFAPDLVVVGGSGTTVSRAYVYTYVTAYGEESAPSPPAEDTGFVNGSWNLDWDSPPAGDMGVNRNITKVRLYRTITSSAGVATYFRVGEFTLPDLDFDDTLDDVFVSGEPQLESFGWTPPPADIQGFTMMPNGIVAGWRDNELWFSEPYRPHAWPAAYVLVVDYPIVGLGIANQTLVVCTAGNPMTASGVNPAYITTAKLTSFEPCTSRESIISAPEGVYYASSSGLVLVQPGSANNITRDIVNIDRWFELTPDKFKAGRYGVAYYAFGALTGGVFDEEAFETENTFVEVDFTGAQQGLLIDPRDANVAFNKLYSEEPTVGLMNDHWSGELMMIRNDTLYWIDSREIEPEYDVYTWRSKVFHANKKINFSAVKVYFTVPSTTPEQNPTRNNDLDQELQAGQYGLMRVYADGAHVATRELRESGELMRLPSEFKAEYWQIEFEARVSITEFMMGTTVKELQVA